MMVGCDAAVGAGEVDDADVTVALTESSVRTFLNVRLYGTPRITLLHIACCTIVSASA